MTTETRGEGMDTDIGPITVRLSEWHALQDANRESHDRIRDLEAAVRTMQIWVVMDEGCGDGNSPEQVFSSVEAAEAAASKGSRLYVCGPFTLDQ